MNPEKEIELREQARSIIRNYAITMGTASGALAVGVVFGAEISLLVPVLTKLVSELGKLFDIKTDSLNEAFIKRLVLVFVGVYAARTIAKTAIGFFPIIGNAVVGITNYNAILVIGWLVYEVFKDGRTLESLDDEDIKEYIKKAKSEHLNK